MMLGKNAWFQSRPWLDEDDVDIEGYVAKLDYDPGYDLLGALKAWHSDGVVIFRDVVDHAEIDALVGDVAHLRQKPEDYELSVEVRGRQLTLDQVSSEDLNSSGLKFNSIHTISPAAARLSLTRVSTDFLKHVFKDAPCLLQSLTFHKGSQQPIHIDYPYVRCQSPLSHLAASWIPLEDIHPDSGPLAYYPGSHRVQNSDFFDWGGGSIVLEADSTRNPEELSAYLYARMRECGIEPVTFCPRKGDVLIWHGNLSHEGTAIRAPDLSRMSYVTHYSSRTAYPPAHRYQTSDAAAALHHAHGGYVFRYPWLGELKQLPSTQIFNHKKDRA